MHLNTFGCDIHHVYVYIYICILFVLFLTNLIFGFCCLNYGTDYSPVAVYSYTQSMPNLMVYQKKQIGYSMIFPEHVSVLLIIIILHSTFGYF